SGLKGTAAYCAIGSAFSIFAFKASWRQKIIYFISYGVSGVFGVLLGGGYWFWALWSHFGNPFFPFFNSIFASPYMQPWVYTKIFAYTNHFRPHSLLEYLSWPYIFSFDSLRVGQIQFSDVRFALLYTLTIIWLFVSVIKILRSKNWEHRTAKEYLIQFNESNFLLIFS